MCCTYKNISTKWLDNESQPVNIFIKVGLVPASASGHRIVSPTRDSNMIVPLLTIILFYGANGLSAAKTDEPKYFPNWTSLDSRPLPDWYDKAKIGIIVHWGIYSVPSFTSEWFWIDWQGNPSPNKVYQDKINKFMKYNYKPGFSYQEFANEFTAEFFDPDQWADLFEKAGARYVVLTSKHHDGYALWPSNYSFSWNSMDIGPHKDIISYLSKAIRKKQNLRFGLYHSFYEWFNPLWILDKNNNFSTNYFVNNKVYPEMLELINTYKPEIFWSDGEWEAPSSYWRSEEFLAWLYNYSPVKQNIVVNDRWGHDTLCKHGGYYTCQDRYNPGTYQQHKWENAMTIDKKTWGYNRLSTLSDYISFQELIDTLVATVACGGNILINVGPTKDGLILPIFQERLLDLGSWLKVNGEGIYESKAWDNCQNDTLAPNVWYTTSNTGNDLYIYVLRWPKNGTLTLECPRVSKKSIVTLLDGKQNLQVTTTDKKLLKIAFPDKANVSNNFGWAIKITKYQKV